MTIEELLGILDELAPRTEQLGWDNSGLLIGHRDREVRKIYLAVDATEEVIRHAREFGADVLLTHHPLIFTKLSRIRILIFTACEKQLIPNWGYIQLAWLVTTQGRVTL